MRKLLMSLMVVVLLLSMATLGVSANEAVKYEPELSETDNGEVMWWVGTNLNVDLIGDNGFSFESLDGTIINANVAWGFTYAQLKQTPYLNITIGNEQSADQSPYMKLYFLAGKNNTMGTVAPFQDNLLEHWVRSGTMSGTHCVDLKKAVDRVPFMKDDDLIILFLYTDPTADLLGPVFVEELFLSNREITADNGNQGGGNVETGAESAVAVAVAAVTGAAALLVICRKK